MYTKSDRERQEVRKVRAWSEDDNETLWTLVLVGVMGGTVFGARLLHANDATVAVMAGCALAGTVWLVWSVGRELARRYKE